MDLVTFGLRISIGTSSGGNRRQYRSALHMYTCTYACWEELGRQWEAMDLVTFGLGITIGTSSGGNGRQWIWQLSGWESTLGQAQEATGGNGRQWIW